MAGDWIKMRVDLADDPAVIGIAAVTGLDEDTVVGKLHRLWAWADRQTTDGNAPAVTKTWIDRYLRAEGFAEAMVSAGWLNAKSGGITFPKFDRHNGETGKQRALTAKRVAKYKSNNGNAKVTPSALPRDNTLLFSESVDSPVLREALENWLAYKSEKGFQYKPRRIEGAGFSDRNACHSSRRTSRGRCDSAGYRQRLQGLGHRRLVYRQGAG